MTRIALVDDDASIHRSLSRLLRSHGYECVAYESAEAALASPELSQIDCLLIDIELPSMDGFALRDRLHDLGITISAIFLTAHLACDIPAWGSRMGESYFLAKPVDEQLLFSAIERLTLCKSLGKSVANRLDSW